MSGAIIEVVTYLIAGGFVAFSGWMAFSATRQARRREQMRSRHTQSRERVLRDLGIEEE